MTEETTNPVDGEAMPEVVDALAGENDGLEPNEVNQDEVELDEDGNPIEEFEEVVRGDKTYRVPKALAGELLMQSDYTRKTQEVSELRKATEAQRQSLETAARQQQEFVQDIAQLGALNDRLSVYQGIDWPAYLRSGNPEAQAQWAEFNALQTQRNQFAQQVQGKITQRQQQEAAETQQALESGRAEIAKHIKTYSPELENKLADFGTEYGFSREDILQAVADPRSIRVLHDAFLGRQARKSQAAASQIQQSESVRPAKTVTARSVPPAGLSDRLGADEWMKRRQQQLSKR